MVKVLNKIPASVNKFINFCRKHIVEIVLLIVVVIVLYFVVKGFTNPTPRPNTPMETIVIDRDDNGKLEVETAEETKAIEEGFYQCDHNNASDLQPKESGKKNIVLFYAPWCGYCKEFKPIFEKVQRMNLNTNVNFMQVNCDSDCKDLCSALDIDGYPTMKVFDGQSHSATPSSARTEDGLKAFVKSL